jgi:hypothetical protein
MTTRSGRSATLGALAAAGALLAVGTGTASAAPDYAALPVNPNAITDSTAYTALPPVVDPDGKRGVQQEFNHRDGTRGITTTIRVLPTPAEATAAVDAMRNDLAPIVLGQNTTPVEVGAGGTMVTGMSPDGAQSVGVLLFAQGDAAVEVQFDGPANDPVPTDMATQYGQEQASAITRTGV